MQPIGMEVARLITEAFAHAPEIVIEEIERAMEESLDVLKTQMQMLTPQAHGILRSAYYTRLYASPASGAVFGEVGNPASYAMPVELGTKPHFPPIEPLITWAATKFGLDEYDAEIAARGVQRKIGHRGTQGAHMARQSLDHLAPWIRDQFAVAAERITARLAQEGRAAQ